MSDSSIQSPVRNVNESSEQPASGRSTTSINLVIGQIVVSKKGNKHYRITGTTPETLTMLCLESGRKRKIIKTEFSNNYRVKVEPKPQVERFDPKVLNPQFEAIGRQFVTLRKDISELEYNIQNMVQPLNKRLKDLEEKMDLILEQLL